MSRMLKALQQLDSAPKPAAPTEERASRVPAVPGAVAVAAPAAVPLAPPQGSPKTDESPASIEGPALPTSRWSTAIGRGAKPSSERSVSIVVVPMQRQTPSESASESESRMALTLDNLLQSMSKEVDSPPATEKEPQKVAPPQAVSAEPALPSHAPLAEPAHDDLAATMTEPEDEDEARLLPTSVAAPIEPWANEAAAGESSAPAALPRAAPVPSGPYHDIVEAMLAQLHAPCPLILLVPCEASRAQAAVLEPLVEALRQRLQGPVRLASGQELAQSPDWQATLRDWRAGHRAVLLAGPSADNRLASLLAACCDGTYLVLRQRQTLRQSAAQAVERLEADGARVLGCVLVTGQ